MVEKGQKWYQFYRNKPQKNRIFCCHFHPCVGSDGAGVPGALDNMRGWTELVQGHKIRICLIQLWFVEKLLYTVCCGKNVNYLVKTTMKHPPLYLPWTIIKNLHFHSFGKKNKSRKQSKVLSKLYYTKAVAPKKKLVVPSVWLTFYF